LEDFKCDFFLQVPNGCGCFLGTLQLVLYAIYRNNKGNEVGENNSGKDSVEMEQTKYSNSNGVIDDKNMEKLNNQIQQKIINQV
jgi:Sugar efflux transporter for intercellular exchange